MKRRPVRKVLHVLGERSWEPQFKYLGSTKDILGRREYFASRGIECVELAVKSREDARCLQMLQAMEDLHTYDAVLMEHPRYPMAMKWLKQAHPRIRRVIRGHNAEWIHQRHTAYAYRISGVGDEAWRQKRETKSLKNAKDRLKFDFHCGRLADSVLAIADWEARWYWPLLAPGLGRIVSCPYFLPAGYAEEVRPEAGRAKLCISMMSADWTPLAQHAAKVLVDTVKAAPEGRFKGWEFVVTGEPAPHGGYEVLDSGGRVRIAGRLDSPFEITSRARALAHLSNLGMGFKTKILDFVLGGGWVLVPRKLYKRQPRELKPFCIVVDPVSPKALARALKKAERAWPDPSKVNERLKKRAYRAMDKAFGYA